MCLEKIQNTRRGLGSGLCLLCFIFILNGCASTEDMGRIQYDLIQLKSEVKDIKGQLSPGQGGQLNKLKGLEEQQKATGKAVSDLLIKVQALITDLQILTGRFEEARYFSEKNSKELIENRDTLTARIKELEAAVNDLKERFAGLESGKAPPEKQEPAENTEKDNEQKAKELKESRSLGTKKELKNIYMEAYKTFKENKFTEAREKFEALLADYPESEYSDNARFWIGETYYKEENYEEAILAYDELLKKNPKSDKVPGAMLKQGLAFYELHDKETGKIILEKLVDRFADSEQAKIARKKLRPSTPLKKKP